MSHDENQNKELTDVDLCYKGLGVPFDAPPNEVEKAYRSLAENIRRDLASSDPLKRKKAKEDAEIIDCLYEKIRNSVNYQRKIRERGHPDHEDRTPKETRIESIVPKKILKICPSCNNAIGKALKICPYCKKRLNSSLLQKIPGGNLLSKYGLLTLAILICIALTIMIFMNFGEISSFITS